MFRAIGVAAAACVFALVSSPAAAVTCPGYSVILTNGTTADASQVMADFNDILTCANTSLAPLSNPGFTGKVSIDVASPQYGIDASIQGINIGGAIGAYNTRPNSTNKAGFLSVPTYNTATPPVLVFAGINTSTTNDMYFGGSSGSYSAATALHFYTAASVGTVTGTERFTVASNGNVGIGTSSPGAALHVVGTIRQTGCTTAGTLAVDSSGNIICYSDARLKNIIGDYSVGLDALELINPKLFTYRSTASNPRETFVHAGFVAQNVMTVIPQASALQHDGFYSLDTTAILAAAVNSIKQLKSLSDKQAVEIAQLKARLAQDEADLASIKIRLGLRSADAGARRRLTDASYK